MKKLGILFDSFPGIEKKKLEKEGFEYINQILILDGNPYNEGTGEISREDLIEKTQNAIDIKTSMPPIGLIHKKFKKLSKKYDQVIFISMVEWMSSTYSVAAAASKEYSNISVLSNKFAGHSAIYYAKKASEMYKNGKSVKEILSYLSNMSKSTLTWVIPRSIEGLIKSGRLSGIKKFILEKGKLIPRLFVGDEEFVVKGVKRNFSKSIQSAIKKTIEQIGGYEKKSEYIWEILNNEDPNSVSIASKTFESLEVKEFNVVPISISTMAYTGKSSIGINVYKK
ncbi:MAG: DegV family protein [Mycoplasmatales bacterium]|nr:DegV family protein [Mycoplasmatales bacterium]